MIKRTCVILLCFAMNAGQNFLCAADNKPVCGPSILKVRKGGVRKWYKDSGVKNEKGDRHVSLNLEGNREHLVFKRCPVAVQEERAQQLKAAVKALSDKKKELADLRKQAEEFDVDKPHHQLLPEENDFDKIPSAREELARAAAITKATKKEEICKKRTKCRSDVRLLISQVSSLKKGGLQRSNAFREKPAEERS